MLSLCASAGFLSQPVVLPSRSDQDAAGRDDVLLGDHNACSHGQTQDLHPRPLTAP